MPGLTLANDEINEGFQLPSKALGARQLQCTQPAWPYDGSVVILAYRFVRPAAAPSVRLRAHRTCRSEGAAQEI
jgi:hypothetical protein